MDAESSVRFQSQDENALAKAKRLLRLDVSQRDEGTSIEYREAKQSLARTQYQVSELLARVEHFRTSAAQFEIASRALAETSAAILAEKGVDDVVGTPGFAAVSEVHKLLLGLLSSSVSVHSEMLVGAIRGGVIPSIENAQAAQRDMYQCLDLRNNLAKEADSLGKTRKMEAAMRAVQAAGSHRDAAAAFAGLQQTAIACMEQVEVDVRAALTTSLAQVTLAQAAEISALAQSARIAGNLMSINMRDPGAGQATPGQTIGAGGGALSSTRRPSMFDQSALATGAAITAVGTSATTALSPEAADFLRNLQVPCSFGEEVIFRADLVRDDQTGLFGTLVATNYRLRVFGSKLYELSKLRPITTADLDADAASAPPVSNALMDRNPSSSLDFSVSNAAALLPSTHHAPLYSHLPVTCIPLLAVARMEAIGGAQGSLVIGTTDMRVLSLSFAQTSGYNVEDLVANVLGPRVWARHPEFAFKFRLDPPSPVDGWSLYTPASEWARLKAVSLLANNYAVAMLSASTPAGERRGSSFTTASPWGASSADAAPTADRFSISAINADFRLCSTYPDVVILPASLPEHIVATAAKFRSKHRLPAVSWFRGSLCLARCSQPLSGVFNNRCPEDERLLAALIADRDAAALASSSSALVTAVSPPGSRAGSIDGFTGISNADRVLAIFDARPRLNAIGNAAKGGGTEVMANYPFATLEYLNIDNIHVVREALAELRALLIRQVRQSLQVNLERHAASTASMHRTASMAVFGNQSSGSGNVKGMTLTVGPSSSGSLVHDDSTLTPGPHLHAGASAQYSAAALVTPHRPGLQLSPHHLDANSFVSPGVSSSSLPVLAVVGSATSTCVAEVDGSPRTPFGVDDDDEDDRRHDRGGSRLQLIHRLSTDDTMLLGSGIMPSSSPVSPSDVLGDGAAVDAALGRMTSQSMPGPRPSIYSRVTGAGDDEDEQDDVAQAVDLAVAAASSNRQLSAMPAALVASPSAAQPGMQLSAPPLPHDNAEPAGVLAGVGDEAGATARTGSTASVGTTSSQASESSHARRERIRAMGMQNQSSATLAGMNGVGTASQSIAESAEPHGAPHVEPHGMPANAVSCAVPAAPLHHGDATSPAAAQASHAHAAHHHVPPHHAAYHHQPQPHEHDNQHPHHGVDHGQALPPHQQYLEQYQQHYPAATGRRSSLTGGIDHVVSYGHHQPHAHLAHHHNGEQQSGHHGGASGHAVVQPPALSAAGWGGTATPPSHHQQQQQQQLHQQQQQLHHQPHVAVQQQHQLHQLQLAPIATQQQLQQQQAGSGKQQPKKRRGSIFPLIASMKIALRRIVPHRRKLTGKAGKDGAPGQLQQLSTGHNGMAGADSPSASRNNSFSWPSSSAATVAGSNGSMYPGGAAGQSQHHYSSFDGSGVSYAADTALVPSHASGVPPRPIRRESSAGSSGGGGVSKRPDRVPLWIKLVSVQLEGGLKVAQKLLSGTSVLVHCSDGWDRTSALTALAQLMVDPYYRTLEGACVLLQKEWVSFGHRFGRRCGTGGTDHHRVDAADGQRAPIFIQFLDCVWQMVRQSPTAYQFNDAFLVLLAEHAYSGKFGTFLYDCEKDRAAVKLSAGTVSLWSFVLHPEVRQVLMNPGYCPPEDGSDGRLVPVLPMTNVDSMAIWPYWTARWTTAD